MLTTPVLLRRRRSGGNPLAAYAAGGVNPATVIDFENDKYLGTVTSLSDLTFSATSNATVIDSDGLLKWRAHNLALNSATPATQSRTVISGAKYTVAITGSGSVTLSNAGTGTVTAGSPVEITAGSTTLTLTVSGSPSTMWMYRSDLGGMQNNPLTGDSYVPTTSAAVYMPRLDYSDGEAAVLVEPTAATNLASAQPVNGTWNATRASWNTGTLAVSSTGNADMPLLIEDTTVTNNHSGGYIASVSAVDANVCVSFEVAEPASNSRRYAQVRLYDNTATTGGAGFWGHYDIVYDAQTQTITATGSGGTVANTNSGVITLPNGKKRVWMCLTKQGGATRTDIQFFLSDNPGWVANRVYTGDGVSGLHFGNVQMEESLFPTSYIPTIGATATRAAETLALPAAKIAAYTTAVGFAMDGTMTGQGVPLRWYVDANNYVTHTINGDGDVVFEQAASGTVDNAESTTAYTLGVNTAFSIAGRHGSTFVQGAADGTANTANTTPIALFNGSAANISLAYSGGPMRIKKFIMWNEDIGTTGIEEASA